MAAAGFIELDKDKLKTGEAAAELNRMLSLLFEIAGGDGETRRIYSGYGTPESVISADIGSLYMRYDGGVSTAIYAKETGTGATGWCGLTCSGGGGGGTPAGSDTEIQYNQSGAFGAEPAFAWQYTPNVLSIGGDIGFQHAGPSGGDLGDGARNIYTVNSTVVNEVADTLHIYSGTGNGTSSGGNLFLNAGDGGASSGTGGIIEIAGGSGGLTDGYGGYITLNGGPGNGSGFGNDVILNGGAGGSTGGGGSIDLTAGPGGTTSGAGGDVTILGGSAPTTGSGGDITITGGNASGASGFGGDFIGTAGNGAGTTIGGGAYLNGGNGGATGQGGPVVITAGDGGSTSGKGGRVDIFAGTPTSGDGGSIIIQADNGFGTNKNGGSINLTTGSPTGSGGGGVIQIERNGSNSGLSVEQVLLRSNNFTMTLASGATITNERMNQFLAPTINGVAGGAAETVTNAATFYIDASPSGSNITITNSYAMWIDSGSSRFDGNLDFSAADSTNLILGTTTGTKIGTSTSQKLGFFNKTPVAQPSAYTPTNVTTDRSYDANATTVDELADVLGTLIADLQSLGLVA